MVCVVYMEWYTPVGEVYFLLQPVEQQNQWKLVTLWIGGNDLCKRCGVCSVNRTLTIHPMYIHVCVYPCPMYPLSYVSYAPALKAGHTVSYSSIVYILYVCLFVRFI